MPSTCIQQEAGPERVERHGRCRDRHLPAIHPLCPSIPRKTGHHSHGNGITLPHATVDQLQQTTTLVASLEQPVDFDSPDGREIDIVCIVLGAPESQGSYLGAIRFVTETLNQNADAIRDAQNIGQLEAAMAASREAAA